MSYLFKTYQRNLDPKTVNMAIKKKFTITPVLRKRPKSLTSVLECKLSVDCFRFQAVGAEWDNRDPTQGLFPVQKITEDVSDSNKP